MSMRAQRMPQNDVIWSNNSSSSSTDNSDDMYVDKGHQELTRAASDKERTASATISLPSELSETPLNGDNKLTDLEKELIATKCELAKVLNKQSCFQEILKQKDEIIEDLDEKLGNRSFNNESYDSKKRTTAANKEHQERVRVLQNQNRFLNEELRRLAKLRNQEHDKIKIQESKVRKLEADIEVWKLEYISLIQSSIRFTGTDTMDDAELSLFGGDRHKNRIIALLEEARKINPSLPTFELLSRGEVHVDQYGFKHHFSDEGLLLHYLCQELSQHFLFQASSYEKHQRNWLQYLKNNSKNLMANKKVLKTLVRNGIPDVHRKTMWKAFVMAQVEDIVIEKGAHYFRSLCNAVPDSPLAARYRKQISLDLMRTMPTNVKFSTQCCKGIMDLQDVLLAFCIHNPHVGYCQGMNFLVAMALLFMDAQDAFWTLVAVTERYHSPSYFDHNLLGAQADQAVLHDLMSEKLSELAKHLDAIDIEISTVTLNWFLALFFDAVPFPTLIRVWDCFLLEGPKVLFRFALAILHIHSREIILKCDTISVMRHLKACAKITYDVDGLIMAAFKTLKPFPRRQDIVSKQTCYLNALKEKYKWRDIQRVTFAERENVYISMECDADKYTGFECCTVTKPGEAWVAYSDPPCVKICVVDCKEQTMTDTNITFDTRVLSMIYGNDEMVLMGTLSWFVFAYSQPTKELLWQQRLHDAVLSMQLYQDEESDKTYRLFAGLADGTIAVFEGVSSTCNNYDLFYLPVGQSPVTCLQLLDNKLWCACGNNVSIINASTLDPKDRFTVSTNPYDTILSLVPGLPGVWISVRGSSVLELWDSENITCKMLYDTRTGKFPNLRKEEEAYFNSARITSILSLDYNVWVGTGEGILITFDVFSQGQKTPSESSSYVTETFLSGDLELQSWRSSPQKSDLDSQARLEEVEKRVKELFIQQQGTDGVISQSVESIADCSKGGFLAENELRDRGIHSDLKASELQFRESFREQLDQTNFLPCYTHDMNLDLLKKIDLTKKLSADSNQTELSLRTNTSGVSSNDSRRTDLSDQIMLDVSSLHDSGFVQQTVHHRNVVLLDERQTEDSINFNKPLNRSDAVTTGLNSTGDITYDIYTSEAGSSVSEINRNATESSVKENYEKRSSRRSADSGISSIHEKVTKATEQTTNESEVNLDSSTCREESGPACCTNGMNESLTSDPNTEVLANSPLTSAKLAPENTSEPPQNARNLQSALSNGRSISLESNKTTDSDDVFHHETCAIINDNDSSVMNNGELFEEGEDLKVINLTSTYRSSHADFNAVCDEKGAVNTQYSIDDEKNLANKLHLNFNEHSNSAVMSNGEAIATKTVSIQYASQIENNKPAKFLRRVQSLKKNFKVDLNLNSKKPSTKPDKVSEAVSELNLFESVSELNPIKLSPDLELIYNLRETQDINHNLTSASSVSKESLETIIFSDVLLDSISDLSNNVVTTSLIPHVTVATSMMPNINSENLVNLTSDSLQNQDIDNSLPILNPENCPVNENLLDQLNSQLQETETKNIDTKFYGDSDEDSLVHEARVQTFKDSYKRMSNVNSKFKLFNDVIPENANGPVSKASKFSSSKDNNSSNGSYTSSETYSRSSDISSSFGVPKKTLSAIGRQSSDASIVLGNVQPKDPDAQWRLDYTNIHVDTDAEGSVMSSALCDGQGDSLPESRRLSCISTNSDLNDQRMKQFLRDTASSFSSQIGHSSEDDKIMSFLSTPNMSDCNSAGWSSYDDISTPSRDNDSVRYRMPRPSAYNLESRGTSIASTLDLYAGGTDLTLMSKNKISDKPVKWLLSSEIVGKPVILSFSGSHSDDEAVLLWTREVKETLWTNAPILEYNPTTKRATLPSYMRPQMVSSARTSPGIKVSSPSGT